MYTFRKHLCGQHTLWAVRTAEEARDSRGLMGTGARFMICLNRP